MKNSQLRDGGGDPPAGRNAERDFRSEWRSNATHASATDPDTRLYRKGSSQPRRLCFMDHLLMENASALSRASGTAEREAALARLGRQGKRRGVTLGADMMPESRRTHPYPRRRPTANPQTRRR